MNLNHLEHEKLKIFQRGMQFSNGKIVATIVDIDEKNTGLLKVDVQDHGLIWFDQNGTLLPSGMTCGFKLHLSNMELEVILPEEVGFYKHPVQPFDKPIDMVNKPPHYKGHKSGVECIEITRHMNFNLGNAIKYLWRSEFKNSQIQDLEKAIWYINDEIKRLKQFDGNEKSF